MDLTKFNFPKVSTVDMVFPTLPTNRELLLEAKNRGYYNGNTPYNKLFSTLFFLGGKVKFKKNVDQEFSNNAWNYVRCFMGSWEPKHEEKEAICGYLN